MKCSKCGATEGLIKYAKVHGKQYYYCNPCNTNRSKSYRVRGGMKSFKKSVLKYQARNPERVAAWKAAQSIPIKPCEVCGTNKHVHRHHDDPANKLDIIFLCALHHKKRHAEMAVINRVVML